MKRWLALLLLAAAGTGAVFLWPILFPSPETVIRRQLVELAKLASFAANEGALAKLSNAQKVSGFFAGNAEIAVNLPGRYHQTFSGRDELLQAAVAARQNLTSLKVEFLDLNVMLGAGKQTATVNLTAKAWFGGDRDYQIQELKFFLKRIDGDWLITRVETVKTLSLLVRQPPSVAGTA